ncbi:MAG: ectoine hydroxylase [Hyphomonadaceae bacterium]
MQDFYPSRIAPKPEWIARKDPVIHAADRSASPVGVEAIDAFERDGFLVLEDVLSGEEVSALRREADALRSGRRELDPKSLITERSSGDIRSVFAIHQQSEVLHRLATDDRLTGLARHILGDEIYVHQSRLNYKPAFRGKEFYWHSDFETWHVEDGMPRMRAVSMSVMLDDNHAQAGPTMFVPGSHRSFIACVGETPENHYLTSLKKQEYGVPDEDSLDRLVRETGIVAPAPRAGSVVIFDCNTMHGSNGNITPYARANAFFVFNAWSNRLVDPFGGRDPRPEFIAHRRVDAPLGSRDRRKAA